MTEWNGIKVGRLYKMSGEEKWAYTEYLPRAPLLMVVGIEPPEVDGGWGSRAYVTLLTPEGVLTARSVGLQERGRGFNEVDFDAQDGDWNDEWNRYVEVA